MNNVNNRRRLQIIIIGLLLFFLIGLGCSKEENTDPIEPVHSEEPAVEEVVPEEPEGIYNPLTGLYVQEVQPITAVMFDNLAAARPQSGLLHADLVYEIEAEGRVTRLLAFFYGDPPEFAGPVRSARPYFMQLVKEYDAYFVHVGGSNDAFAKVVEWKIRDIDDIRGHRGFFLDPARKRPHSTYINFAEALKDKADNGQFYERNFLDYDQAVDVHKQLSLNYGSYNRVSYVWDQSRGVYLRSINEKPHEDRESGEQIYAHNVIVQYASHRSLQTDLQHIWVDVVGSGKAEYFIAGQHYTGSWEKKGMTEATKYYDETGSPIPFVKGKTWVQVVRPSSQVSWE